jgi:hypothetical protein
MLRVRNKKEPAMTRHITDRDRESADNDRLRAFVEIERAEAPNPAAKKAQRQGNRGADAGRRVEEFVRIEKGREA